MLGLEGTLAWQHETVLDDAVELRGGDASVSCKYTLLILCPGRGLAAAVQLPLLPQQLLDHGPG